MTPGRTRPVVGATGSLPASAPAFLALAFVPFASLLQAQEPPAPPPEKTLAEEIPTLIRALADSSYDARTLAHRQLLVIGWPAKKALLAAAEGPDAEIAIRAKQILAIFDQLYFLGAEVSLAFSKPQIAWDEPVDLIVTVVNRSPYPMQVPFDADPAVRARETPDARQVADLLDVAEWLKVRRPDGELVELRVDDLAGDASVSQLVAARAENAAATKVPPGDTVVLIVQAFNRGWARYPLLETGPSYATLDYVPAWDDPWLRTTRGGRVYSNSASVTVKESAPADVGRQGREAEIVLRRESGFFIAKLVNHDDVPIQFNANYGGGPPFADVRWILECDADRRDLGTSLPSGSTWKDFAAEKLLDIGPGQSLELTRIADADVRRALSEPGLKGGDDGWQLAFGYSNLCDRGWQANQSPVFLKDEKTPAVLRDPLPRRLLNARLISNRLPAR